MFTHGAVYRRRDLHERFGGQQQGGISTPSHYPIILLFTGETGEQYGYKDGWTEDGLYLYTGEGQHGNMSFTRGNRAIRDHIQDGKDLHLFKQAGRTTVEYIGQMVCIGHQLRRGPDAHDQDRQVIIFELAPADSAELLADVATEPDEQALWHEPLASLRQKALASATDAPTPRERKHQIYMRSAAIRIYAHQRADGNCESCGNPAPFQTADGRPYLEVHHLRRLSDLGPDHPSHVAALCPNCHRRAHYGDDKTAFNKRLAQSVDDRETAFVE